MKFNRIINITVGLLVGYTVLIVVVKLFFNFILRNRETISTVYQNSTALHLLPLFFISFFLFFTTLVYLFNSWLEGKWVPLVWTKILLYMGAFAGAGPTAEIVGNYIMRLAVHHPLWMYQFLPVHGGDTSIVMAVIWPLYGFHMYCFHTALQNRHDKTTDFDMSIFVGIDAISIEVLANIFAIFFFYTYIFYYLAGDLNHLSTALVFVPYIIFGFLVIKVLHVIEKIHHRIFFGIFGFVWGWFLVFLLK